MSINPQIEKDLKTFDKETGICNRIQKLYINPMVGTCNLFLLQMEELNRWYDNKLPPILKNVLNNLETLMKQYEEDKNHAVKR